MAEEKKEEQKSEKGKQSNEWDQYIQKFLQAVPPVDPNTLTSAEQTLKYLKELVQKVPESIGSTIKVLIELLQETTNIKGMEVQLKSLRILDLKMHILKPADIPLNKDIAGIGKIEAIRLYKLIHMQAEIGESASDLKLQIHQGMSFVLSVIFLGGKQVIPLKGSARLLRDPKGEMLVETTSYIPGTDLPVTVSFPLKQIFDEIRKQR